MFMLGRVIHITRVVQLLRKALPGAQAALELQQLHQINNRRAPVELFLTLLSTPVQYCFDIDHWGDSGRGRRR